MRAMQYYFCIGLVCQNCFAHSMMVLVALSMALLNSFSFCFCEALLITQQTFNCSKATIETLQKGK